MAYVPVRRIAAGGAAGLVAGATLHLVLVAADALGPIAAATPLGTEGQVAVANLASSVLLGLGFAALPVTGPWVRGLAWGLAWGLATWLVLDQLVVRAWAALPPGLDGAALLGLGGRLVWGAMLGLAFVALMLALFRAREARGSPT